MGMTRMADQRNRSAKYASVVTSRPCDSTISSRPRMAVEGMWIRDHHMIPPQPTALRMSSNTANQKRMKANICTSRLRVKNSPSETGSNADSPANSDGASTLINLHAPNIVLRRGERARRRVRKTCWLNNDIVPERSKQHRPLLCRPGGVHH